MNSKLSLYLLLSTSLATSLLATSCQKMSDIVGGDDDGYNAPQPDDQDGDGILDVFEGQDDQDGDGIPNYLDTDSDGDCISDRIESGSLGEDTMPIDSDGDDIPDFLDTDSDNNSLPDSSECGSCTNPLDADNDGLADYTDQDDDNDNIYDVDDGFADFDGDGTLNYRDTDSDGDCIADMVEVGDDDPTTSAVDSDSDGSPDFLDIDSDDDGIPDTTEVDGACDPVGDLDGDGVADYIDTDIDGDGLANDYELSIGTDSRNRDSDSDGATDGLEVFAETDPTEVADFPHGAIITTGPRQSTEEVSTFTVDTNRIDIYVLLDTSYSYSCYHPNLPSFIESLVDAVFAAYDDVTVGFGIYDDYNYESNWAASGGVPYLMVHQLSTDQTSVKSAATEHQMVYGGDSYGSAYEALYQTVTGMGWDQQCDALFATSTDIQPFKADAADPFSGTCPGTYDENVEGTGDIDGVGWRTASERVVIVTADNIIRDEDRGHDMPSGCCFAAADFDRAINATNDLGAHTLGVNVYEYQTYDGVLQQQLEEMAVGTNSYIDSDGDGEKDDPAVLYGSWNWPPIEEVIEALWDLAEEKPPVDLWFEVDKDDNGWISDIVPTTVLYGLTEGDTVDLHFTVSTAAPTTSDDQFYYASIAAMTEEGVYDLQEIWLVIRPEYQ